MQMKDTTMKKFNRDKWSAKSFQLYDDLKNYLTSFLGRLIQFKDNRTPFYIFFDIYKNFSNMPIESIIIYGVYNNLELVKKYLNSGDSFSDMWLKFSQEKYPYDDNFRSVSSYMIGNKLENNSLILKKKQ